MAFLIRTIDFTAAGREIIRDRVVEQAGLTIGRAAENDIHLPDLAVEQRHVRIDTRPDGTLAVSAVGTLGFGLDGRTVTEGTIEPRTGGEIALGAARLAVARESDGTISVTIRQVVADEGKGDVLRGFSLASKLPSKRSVSWIFAGAIMLLLLMVPVASHLLRTPVKNDPKGETPGQVVMDAAWSTGDLSLRHHSLEDNCESCHVAAFESVQDETCISCHEGTGDHARAGRLAAGMPSLSTGDALQWRIAQSLGKEGPLGCVSCHTEHEGEVRQQPASEAFCSDCHSDLDTRLTDTRLADAHDFGKAHPQFRPAYYASFGAAKPVRAAPGSTPVEKSGLKFPHDVHMDAKGGAARMAVSLPDYGSPLECKDCHSLTPDKISFTEVKMEDACESCHSLVSGRTAAGGFSKLRHGDVKDLAEDLARIGSGPRATPASNRTRPGQFARGGAYAADFGRPVRSFIDLSNALAPGGICTECHLPATRDGRRDLMAVNLPDRFLTTGFFSHEAHKKEECTDCHAADTSKAATDLLIPDLKSCRDCHLGASAVKTKKIVPSSCAMCHAYHVPAGQWSPEAAKDDPHYRPLPVAGETKVAAKLSRAKP
ncbi:cytochrome c3 family protein [Erythrobacter dokdonensis]|uniref:Cytochrome c family protein n=1 Tax=Erythrobacter dokdonensis DSW-74 TaxID=1300349 RepID=A0A1A7BFM6_9SPHN|nr:cytochrome c3 family protein [Erythrobacter dokdonensis]OBV10025.1 Cytochrome c family protein [Erythrobacter dokdonensis DSW-74]